MDDLVGFVNDNKVILNIIKMIYLKSKRIPSTEMYFEVFSIKLSYIKNVPFNLYYEFIEFQNIKSKLKLDHMKYLLQDLV